MCVKMVRHILLESSRQELQFWRSTKEIMGLQSAENLNFGNFETPDLGISKQNGIWV
jgi:hypothetical protein